jgi:uncharacterized protein
VNQNSVEELVDVRKRSAAFLTPSPAFSCGGGAKVSALVRALALSAALGVYRLLVSPLLLMTLGPACRFEPTCSQYAHQALEEHGLARGLYLTVRRLMRCRPLGGWGYDPVPAPADTRPASFSKEKFG